MGVVLFDPQSIRLSHLEFKKEKTFLFFCKRLLQNYKETLKHETIESEKEKKEKQLDFGADKKEKK